MSIPVQAPALEQYSHAEPIPAKPSAVKHILAAIFQVIREIECSIDDIFENETTTWRLDAGFRHEPGSVQWEATTREVIRCERLKHGR